MKTLLDEARAQIDRIDDRLFALLEQRIRLAQMAGRAREGQRDEEREAQILARAEQYDSSVREIMKSIIEICRKKQQ